MVATMTPASLGRRSGSYGSLQGAAALGASRKPSKAALPLGSREKESRLRWIQRVVVRPNVGMLLVFLISAVVLIPHFSFSTVYVQHIIYLPSNYFWLPQVVNDNREVNTMSMIKPQSAGSEYGIRPPVPVLPPSTIHINRKVNTMSMIKPQSASSENGIRPPVPVLPPSTIPVRHPCENFSFPPPPPPGSKRTGPRPCPVCYVPVEQAMALMQGSPSVSPVLKNLDYVSEENLVATESNGGSVFGGYPSLQQRTDSYDIRESMTVHCGFVKGKRPGQGTGFDIDDVDLLEMEQCRGIVVASAIFGNYDVMQQPKNISETTKGSVCFYMFVDEETEAYMKNSSNTLDSSKRVGLWRVVVVRNLPYVDARRNGKVPKLLLHRLFPNVRYSLWIDGKLELVVDPYQILERFLWRERASFAISRHYKRFDVFEEAEANKAAGKYDNASIDSQIEFYKKEGLTPYSLAKLPITSDVPEGCVIIREHIPITNLFTCLWFNEVDRFTSRDQLSFGIVRDKIMSKSNWTINMFKDCERRNFVIQAYHRDLLEQKHSAASQSYPPPPVLTNESPEKLLPGFVLDRIPRSPVRKSPVRRGRDRRPGSRRHRPRAAHGRDVDF